MPVPFTLMSDCYLVAFSTSLIEDGKKISQVGLQTWLPSFLALKHLLRGGYYSINLATPRLWCRSTSVGAEGASRLEPGLGCPIFFAGNEPFRPAGEIGQLCRHRKGATEVHLEELQTTKVSFCIGQFNLQWLCTFYFWFEKSRLS